MIRLTVNSDQARALLARSMPYCVDGAAVDLGDMTRGCDVFEVVDEAGRMVGAFAAQVLTYSDGKTIAVTAAGGEPGQDIAGDVAAWAEHQAAGIGANALTCTTKRPGLVRRLKKQGYTVAGFVLRKELKNGQ